MLEQVVNTAALLITNKNTHIYRDVLAENQVHFSQKTKNKNKMNL